ncbi:MAG: hypothetical protein LBI95_02530 [Holosporales bacterium]|nr:hypothetical protein [Holosporales bacterium]
MRNLAVAASALNTDSGAVAYSDPLSADSATTVLPVDSIAAASALNTDSGTVAYSEPPFVDSATTALPADSIVAASALNTDSGTVAYSDPPSAAFLLPLLALRHRSIHILCLNTFYSSYITIINHPPPY